MTRAAAFAAVVFAALVSGPAAQSPPPKPELALAIIRPDGILTPFAVFDGKTWTAAWPEPQDTRTIDGMLERVDSFWRKHQEQVPLTWHVVRPGQAALQVKMLKYVLFEEHCENQVGLLTDMQPRREVDSMSSARLLAADKPLSLEMPITLTEAAASAEWKDFLQAIHRDVARQEAAAIAEREKHSGGGMALPPPPKREPVRLRSILVHKTPDGGRTMFYEALRDYRGAANPSDWERPVFVASGWAHAEAGKAPSIRAARSALSNWTYSIGTSHSPMGVLTSHGATFWIALEIGYEGEGMSVVQIAPNGVREVLSTHIGGC